MLHFFFSFGKRDESKGSESPVSSDLPATETQDLSSSAMVDLVEDWRRISIFRTRVRCKCKICNLIIDGGSVMNIVAQEVIDKLQLPTNKKPKPCKVAWVDDHAIPVTRQCLVPFKIDILEDEIWCGIITMNTTYFLDGHGCLIERYILIKRSICILLCGKDT